MPNPEKIQRAIACLEAVPAEEIGKADIITRLYAQTFQPCCSIGHLLVCAGVPAKEQARRKYTGTPFDNHPELTEVYDLDRDNASRLALHNDTSADGPERKLAVLAFLQSLLPTD